MEEKYKKEEKKYVPRKKFSIIYKLKIQEKVVEVCKTMFLTTLNISESWIKTIVSKLKRGYDVSPDRRGKNSKRGNVIPEVVKESIREHINLSPRKESHYIRKDSKKEYLDQHLSMATMHDFYVQIICCLFKFCFYFNQFYLLSIL